MRYVIFLLFLATPALAQEVPVELVIEQIFPKGIAEIDETRQRNAAVLGRNPQGPTQVIA